MKLSQFILSTTMFAAVLATPASAESNWLIAGEYGQKPDRTVVMIDIGETKVDHLRWEDEGPFIGMPIFIVYESADKPDWSRLTLRNYCDDKKNEIADANTYWRHDVNEAGVQHIKFTPTPEFSTLLFSLACGDTAAALNSGQFKPIDPVSAKDPYPGSYPWKKMWLDGKRPPYSTNDKRTRAEKDAEFDAQMAKARATLAGGVAMAEAVIEKDKTETAFWEDQAERRKYRPKSKLNSFLEAWLRKDEQFIVQNLGVPDGVYVAGNSRFLTYFNGWTQRFTTTDAQTGQVVGIDEQSYVCELTMELLDNKMIDFKFKGNSCGYGEFAGR